MGFEPIKKNPEHFKVTPNLDDYARTCAEFAWEKAEASNHKASWQSRIEYRLRVRRSSCEFITARSVGVTVD